MLTKVVKKIKGASRKVKASVVGAVGSASAFAGSADVYGQSVDVSTTEVLALAGVVVAGSLVIWGIRKTVSLSNKS